MSETTKNTAAKTLGEMTDTEIKFEAMILAKYHQAITNGATEDQAIKAVRELWLDATVRKAR